jgi:transposase
MHAAACGAWLAAVEADDQAGLRSFTIGVRNDMQAVTNGLTLHWNSGRVEGTVNKIISGIRSVNSRR